MRAVTGTTNSPVHELWRVDLTPGSEAWIKMTIDGTPPQNSMLAGQAQHDRVGNQIVLFGGSSDGADVYDNAVWSIAYLED